jgi:hypothetical protein
MKTLINGYPLEIALDENENLKVKGVEQYTDERIRQNVISYLKICKPEIIQKIKSGMDVEPISPVEKMTVCKDGLQCQYIGLSSDESGTYATCQKNGGRIHDFDFQCPLALSRYRRLKKMVKPKGNNF